MPEVESPGIPGSERGFEAPTENLALRWLDRILSLVHPNICQVCHREVAGARDGYVCARCKENNDGVQFIQLPFCARCGLPFAGEITVRFECSNCRDQTLDFTFARAAVRFSGVVREVILRYKYHHATWFEPFLADLLIRVAGPELRSGQWDWITPIPLHWFKLRQRAFNQSERLAERLSRATGIPLKRRLLRRVEPTPTQTRLSRAQRIENVKRAFAYRAGKPLEGRSIVLIDDVLTTGATASACAKVLRQNGARAVCVWTVARGMLQ